MLTACKMKNCVVVLFFEYEQEKRSGKILKGGEKSVAHIKVTFFSQIQVHGIEENIERPQGVIWLLFL